MLAQVVASRESLTLKLGDSARLFLLVLSLPRLLVANFSLVQQRFNRDLVLPDYCQGHIDLFHRAL